MIYFTQWFDYLFVAHDFVTYPVKFAVFFFSYENRFQCSVLQQFLSNKIFSLFLLLQSCSFLYFSPWSIQSTILCFLNVFCLSGLGKGDFVVINKRIGCNLLLMFSKIACKITHHSYTRIKLLGQMINPPEVCQKHYITLISYIFTIEYKVQLIEK